MSQQECESQNCCWVPAQFPGAPHVDLPWCFHPNAEPSEYRVVDMRRSGECDLHACCSCISLIMADHHHATVCHIKLFPATFGPLIAQLGSSSRGSSKCVCEPAGGSTHARLELSRSVQPGLGADIQVSHLDACSHTCICATQLALAGAS